MSSCQREPVEVDPHDRLLLEQIGRLRVRAWATHSPIALEHPDGWLDQFNLSARHWVIFDNETPIAAARFSVHHELCTVPDASFFDGVFAVAPPAPIASFNRLVVHPDYRGAALSRELDQIRVAAAIGAGCRSAIGETPSGPSRVAQLKSLGFQVIGPSRPYPNGYFLNGHGVVLFRELTPRATPPDIAQNVNGRCHTSFVA